MSARISTGSKCPVLSAIATVRRASLDAMQYATRRYCDSRCEDSASTPRCSSIACECRPLTIWRRVLLMRAEADGGSVPTTRETTAVVPISPRNVHEVQHPFRRPHGSNTPSWMVETTHAGAAAAGGDRVLGPARRHRASWARDRGDGHSNLRFHRPTAVQLLLGQLSDHGDYRFVI